MIGVAENYLSEYFSLETVVSVTLLGVYEIMLTEMKFEMPAFSKSNFS